MKKSLLSFLFICITLFANAYDFMVDGLCYNFNNDGTSVTVTSSSTYSNLNGALNIPSSVTYNGTTFLVTSIGTNAFNGCSGLTSVSIPNSVTSIGSIAFQDCSGMASVTIPNSVTSIGTFTFSGCSSLTSVSIPNSVTSIGKGAFRNTGLASVIIPNSVTSIGDYMFAGCSGLNTAIIGENVTSIGEQAFSYCSFLENLVAMRERPIYIESNVFEGVPKASCDLHVRQGSKIRYENQDVWKDFLIIIEDAEDWADVGGGGSGSGVYGDVNGDGYVNALDVTIIYNILLGHE